MKKLLSFILAAITVLSLSACADLSEVGGTPAETNSGTTSGANSDTHTPGTYTVTASYDYRFRPGFATMLYDSNKLFFALPEGYDPPVAGDEFTITYTGEMITFTIYPSVTTVKNGEIQSITGRQAEMRRVTYYAPSEGNPERFVQVNDNGTEEELKIISRPDYYITTADGEFKPLAEVGYSITLFLTYSPVDGRTDEGIKVAGLYAWNPRYKDREIDTDTLSALRELAQNVTLPFALLTKQTDIDLDGYTHEPGFGCDLYTKEGVSLTFSHYPDEANEDCLLTDLTVSGVETVFGGGMNTNAEEIANRLQDNGYTVAGTSFPLRAEKYGVHLTVTEADGVRTLRVAVYSTNDTGIIS